MTRRPRSALPASAAASARPVRVPFAARVVAPRWLVPVAGGTLFTLLVVTVLTSAVWYLGAEGLPHGSGY